MTRAQRRHIEAPPKRQVSGTMVWAVVTTVSLLIAVGIICGQEMGWL